METTIVGYIGFRVCLARFFGGFISFRGRVYKLFFARLFLQSQLGFRVGSMGNGDVPIRL